MEAQAARQDQDEVEAQVARQGQDEVEAQMTKGWRQRVARPPRGPIDRTGLLGHPQSPPVPTIFE
jgi:hypothetical protein